MRSNTVLAAQGIWQSGEVWEGAKGERQGAELDMGSDVPWSICLSVTGLTRPSCLGQLSPNLWLLSESCSGIFFSGTASVRLGSGRKGAEI